MVSAVTTYHEGAKNHEDFQYKKSFVFLVILRGFVKGERTTPTDSTRGP